MTTDTNNEPVRENVVIDGGDPTEQERILIEQGVEETPAEAGEGDAAAAGGEAEANATTGEPAAEEAAAAAGEEAGKEGGEGAAAAEDDAAAQADQARQQRIEQEEAEARRNAEAIAAASGGEKPEAPVDFDAAYKDLKQQRDDGDIEADEYADKVLELGRQETAHKLALHDWEAQQRQLAEEGQRAQERAQNAWNQAALQWEADNQDFMADRVNQAFMQEAINAIVAANQRDGVVASPTVVLEDAARSAFRRANWTPQAPAAAADPQQEVRNAVATRNPQKPPATLGDAPAAGAENIKGNATYEMLDRAPIEDVEEAASRMTAAEQERWLRDAPGANANGRGEDPQG